MSSTSEKYNVQHKGDLKRSALITPLVVPLVLGLAYSAILLFEGFISDAYSALLLYLLLGLPYTYVVTFALVLPMAIFLRKKNALSSVRLCLWCALLAPFTLNLYISLLTTGPKQSPDLFWITISALCGLVSGVSFCLFAKIRIFAR